jgi:hypothetical protein
MPTERELVDPLVHWIRGQWGAGRRLLVLEEPAGKGGRRPDLLAVFGSSDGEGVDETIPVPIEIERSSRGALRDPRNGLRLLNKYPGHGKFLAVPQSVARHRAAEGLPDRCRKFGFGLLIVEIDSDEVTCEVEPQWRRSSRTLRAYPVAMRRWIALRSSTDRYRRIQSRRIVEQE